MTWKELKELKEAYVSIAGSRFKYAMWNEKIYTSLGTIDRGRILCTYNDCEFRRYVQEIRPTRELIKGDTITLSDNSHEYIFQNSLSDGFISLLLKGTKKGRIHAHPQAITSINSRNPYFTSPIVQKLYGLVK